VANPGQTRPRYGSQRAVMQAALYYNRKKARARRAGGDEPEPTPATYSAWNPDDKGSGVVLSESNQLATGGVGGDGVRALELFTGKSYMEFLCDGASGGTFSIGVSTVNETVDINGALVGGTEYGWGFTQNGFKYHNNVPVSIAGGVDALPHVFMMALDLPGGKIWFGIDGTWIGDPASGTGEAYSNVSGEVYPAAWVNDSAVSVRIRRDPADHSYSAPSGFTAGSPDPE